MKLLIAISFLLIGSSSYAQDESSRDVWIEGRVKVGFLAAHRSLMGHLPAEHAIASEFSYILKGKGERNWHYPWKFPTYGYTAFFGTAGNRDLLGYYAGGFGFMTLPMAKMTHWDLGFKVGAGLMFGNKVYDPETNILGVALSSHVNALVHFSLDNRWTFGKNGISLAVDMTHVSNGATKVPNFGLNLPFLSFGYSRQISESNFCTDCPREEKLHHSWEFGGIGIVTSKQENPIGGKRYPVFGLNLMARRYFKSQRGGVELSYDLMSKQSIIDYHPGIAKTQIDILQMGAFAGYIVPLDRLHMIVGMGIYVRDIYKPVDPFYHRVGLRYVFDNGFNAHVVLKSHWGRADYIEYGIGFTLAK